MRVNKIHSSPKLILATTKGLVKKVNEDSMGVLNVNDRLRLCVCDGHWGLVAANLAKDMVLDLPHFPNNLQEAINVTQSIQTLLWKKLGKVRMNPKSDFTPETSLLAIEIDSARRLHILSYGDSRLMVSRNEKIKFKLKTQKTWLGAFSFLGLRSRLSVNIATQFKRLECRTDDLIWLFTDGVDECRYEQPTISHKWLYKLGAEDNSLETIVLKIFEKVERFGAEDNASIAIVRC